MITSAANRSWADDVVLGPGSGEVGLPAPSVIRPCKIATIEAQHAERIGRIGEAPLKQVRQALGRYLGET